MMKQGRTSFLHCDNVRLVLMLVAHWDLRRVGSMVTSYGVFFGLDALLRHPAKRINYLYGICRQTPSSIRDPDCIRGNVRQQPKATDKNGTKSPLVWVKNGGSTPTFLNGATMQHTVIQKALSSVDSKCTETRKFQCYKIRYFLGTLHVHPVLGMGNSTPLDPTQCPTLLRLCIQQPVIMASVLPFYVIVVPSIREHLSYDDCLEDKRKDYQNCSVLYCVTQLCTIICTLISAVLTDELFQDQILCVCVCVCVCFTRVSL